MFSYLILQLWCGEATLFHALVYERGGPVRLHRLAQTLCITATDLVEVFVVLFVDVDGSGFSC